MPRIYDHMGVRFQYPDNWTLDQRDAVAGAQAVSVYSPAGAFWSVAIHDLTAEPPRLIAAVLKVMREEYQDLDVEEIEEVVAGHEMIGYDFNFVCLDLTNTAVVRYVRTKAGVLVIFYQAEDREYAEFENVFRAMTYSLLTKK